MRTFLALLACTLASASAAAQGAIEGVAFDSLRGAPLIRASVIVSAVARKDTTFRSVITDTKGHFSLSNVPEGKYVLAVEHESIDSLGFHIPDVDVDVSYMKTTIVNIATPSSRTLKHALCPSMSDDTNLGVMLGTVRRIDGTPVAGAAVVFSWNDFEYDPPSVSVISHRVIASVTTDNDGVYRKCDLPLERSLFLQAQGGDRIQSGILEEHIGRTGFHLREFRLADDRAAIRAPAPVVEATTTRPMVAFSGIVTDMNNRPVSRAQVYLPGHNRSTSANEQGEFRFSDVPAGTQSLEVMALGYYPVSIRVEADRLAAGIAIHLERTAVILDSLRVIAKRTTKVRLLAHEEFESRRARTAGGTYITRAQLDSMRPVSTYDVLRRAPGIKLAQTGPLDVTISSGRGPAAFNTDLCPMDIFLDGMRVKQEDVRGIPPEAIYGIEVHGMATAPQKYKVGMCGAVFFWTR